MQGIAEAFGQNLNDSLYAPYPNPFLNYNSQMNGEEELLLVDGSETGQTIPLWPVIQPERGVDFIVALDASGDGQNNWVNGTNLYDTSLAAAEAGIPFPTVPPAATLINLNITRLPTFFGCNDSAVPTVLYLPNSPFSGYSNFSYTTLK